MTGEGKGREMTGGPATLVRPSKGRKRDRKEKRRGGGETSSWRSLRVKNRKRGKGGGKEEKE